MDARDSLKHRSKRLSINIIKFVGAIILAVLIIAAVVMIQHNDYQSWQEENPHGTYLQYLFDTDWHDEW